MKHRTAAVMLPAALATALVAPPAAAAPVAPECSTAGNSVRCVFTQPLAIATVFTVPPGVVNLQVSARGGSGGPGDADQSSGCTDGTLTLPRARTVSGALGGLGGTASAILNVEPGQVLDLYVGGVGHSANGITGGAGGMNGGAPGGTVRLDPSTDVCDPFNQFGGGGGGGGGGSFVMAHGTIPQVSVPLLAAGGGGGGGTYAGDPGGDGGAGGGEAGDPGAGGDNRGLGGSDRGGLGGPGADNGDRGSGGLGAATLSAPGAGGGGGGGFFGGGGGGSSLPTDSLAGTKLDVISGGGGGGSGFVASSGPGVRLSKATVGAGSVSGPGEIAISYRAPGDGRDKVAASGKTDRVRAGRVSAGRRVRSGNPSRGR